MDGGKQTVVTGSKTNQTTRSSGCFGKSDKNEAHDCRSWKTQPSELTSTIEPDLRHEYLARNASKAQQISEPDIDGILTNLLQSSLFPSAGEIAERKAEESPTGRNSSRSTLVTESSESDIQNNQSIYDPARRLMPPCPWPPPRKFAR